MRSCAELLRCSLWEMCMRVKSVPRRLWLRSASIGCVQLPECRRQQDSGAFSFGPMGQFPTRNFVTEHFRTETENASLRATTNVFRRRFGVSVTLTPRYKCHNLRVRAKTSYDYYRAAARNTASDVFVFQQDNAPVHRVLDSRVAKLGTHCTLLVFTGRAVDTAPERGCNFGHPWTPSTTRPYRTSTN